MKIGIARKGKDIITVKDYSNIDQKGEISHFLIELELIKQDLLEIWEEYNNKEDETDNLDD